MSSFVFWQRFLLGGSLLTALFGLLLAFFSRSQAFNIIFNNAIDPVFWPEGITPAGVAFQGWVYGAWGSTVAGFGLLLAFIAAGPFKRREGWSYRAILFAVGLWYLVDTAYSALFGVWVNVALNTVLLVIIGLPLFFTRKQFLPSPKASLRRR